MNVNLARHHREGLFVQERRGVKGRVRLCLLDKVAIILAVFVVVLMVLHVAAWVLCFAVGGDG